MSLCPINTYPRIMTGRKGRGVRGDETTVGLDFAGALGELKHAGCTLFVTGNVTESVCAAQARKLFGDPSVSHERVLVVTDTVHAQSSEYLPDDVSTDSQSVHLVDYRAPLRSGTVTQDGQSDAATTSSSVDSVDIVRDSVLETLDSIQSRREPARPSELRVGVVTLSGLLDQYGLDETESFVEAVSTAVREARGMGFFYLPVPTSDPAIDALAPLFDVHVEMRTHGGDTPEHRWNLSDYGLITEWLPL